jgi:hypothetical protein
MFENFISSAQGCGVGVMDLEWDEILGGVRVKIYPL